MGAVSVVGYNRRCELFEQGWCATRVDGVSGAWEGGLAELGNLRQHVLASAGQEWAELGGNSGISDMEGGTQ